MKFFEVVAPEESQDAPGLELAIETFKKNIRWNRFSKNWFSFPPNFLQTAVPNQG